MVRSQSGPSQRVQQVLERKLTTCVPYPSSVALSSPTHHVETHLLVWPSTRLLCREGGVCVITNDMVRDLDVAAKPGDARSRAVVADGFRGSAICD